MQSEPNPLFAAPAPPAPSLTRVNAPFPHVSDANTIQNPSLTRGGAPCPHVSDVSKMHPSLTRGNAPFSHVNDFNTILNPSLTSGNAPFPHVSDDHHHHHLQQFHPNYDPIKTERFEDQTQDVNEQK